MSTNRSEAEELLSAPAEWDLPRSRHLHFKDVLMQQIDEDLASAAAQTPGRRTWRPAVLLPLASMALAGALLVTFTSGDPETPAPVSATATLNRIAVAAMASDETPVRDDQFVYVRRLVIENKGTFEGPVRLGAPHTSEVWTSQNPEPVRVLGWMRDSGKDAIMPGQMLPIESPSAVPAGFDHPTYKWLASLPTDPDALLQLLYKQVRVADDESKEQAVFSQIGDLLSGTVMPPENTAALYKAAARIPGVRELPDAVDAAGRHGIAITREDARSATRDEWIFDKKTLAFLGARNYITHDETKGITSDTLFGSTAVLRHAVVDRHGEEPAKSDG
ncbi:CU044_5270 family protein [Streptomyces fulvoviolaceus]|uniref:CU044_5270 family protein n=1 Tax=Streptomyces fulvoviolaceus TaxID=285535 RepID=UPI0021BE0A8A|nr:CU044_5270 family protein [Streptomyces fulvoviolaceus]MCT9075109.1 CU044_5270 family protein [Streptomyces fulvoviolaceus]